MVNYGQLPKLFKMLNMLINVSISLYCTRFYMHDFTPFHFDSKTFNILTIDNLNFGGLRIYVASPKIEGFYGWESKN